MKTKLLTLLLATLLLFGSPLSASEIQTTDWDSTAADNDATPPNGFPENMLRTTVNDSAREEMAAIKRWFNRSHGLADAGTLISSAGSSATFTVDYDVAPASLFTGLEVEFKANADFGADSTVNVNSLGAVNAQKLTTSGYTNIAAGDIKQTQHVRLKYDGTLAKWVVISPLPTTVTTTSTNTFTADQTLSTSGTGIASPLEITSTDAGASAGPNFSLYRNSATPAASDAGGTIRFNGEDSAGNTQQYGSFFLTISDPTSTSEDGILRWNTVIAGTEAARLRLGAGLYSENATSGDKGADSINFSDIYNDGAALPASVAAQSDQENGSSTTAAVTSGRQQYHASAAKAWAHVTVSGGAPTLTADYGVTSVTDRAQGKFTLVFDTAFSAASAYACTAQASQDVGVSVRFAGKDEDVSTTTTAWPFIVINSAGTAVDPEEIDVTCFGDQ
jgi:hypothetical protein